MFALMLRVAVVVGAVAGTIYATYRLYQNENRYTHYDIGEASRRRRRCVICNNPVQPQDEDNSSCGCLRHRGCMEMLVREGQRVCPGCRQPLSNDSAPNAGASDQDEVNRAGWPYRRRL